LIARPPGTKKPIINGMNFTLKQGRSLAIIGESGSGKSTLTKLLVGVWRPLSGAVRLDGADIYNWPKNELGKFLGYLPQEIELIEGTILENICRFGIEDQKQAENAAKLIGIDEYIKSLKEGYLTKVNEEDGIFSGGQLQKIALARAIYGDPQLVVLDEPNSNLDKKGELDLYKTLDYLKSKGTTVVVVTHRPQILKHVDRILLVSDGKPKIYGPRDLVLQKITNNN
jgi:ABC-type protease/lipase transport system fused ATPase/permease subunit